MRNYRLLTMLVSPLVPLWLRVRAARGKEDPVRMRERFGYASQARPAGTLLWLHAASVGEANSVLPLITALRSRFPTTTIMLTTGTRTSAELMAKRLPTGVIHQYAPVDTPGATQRFARHWRPDFAFWVESELWPNLIETMRAQYAIMGIINARMSERSFQSWQKRMPMIRGMLGAFDMVFAQSEKDAARLRDLGATNVSSPGNIKYDAPALPANEDEVLVLQSGISGRPVWLAASTHPGEEALIAQAHKLLSATRPNLLTIIVPRHPERGGEIAQSLKEWRVQRRVSGVAPAPDTQMYIADTLGELGILYRACDIVFMGGSLVTHGGQNPLEPARLSCTILTGPHVHNFDDIYQDMRDADCVIEISTPQNLAAQLDRLLGNPDQRSALQSKVSQWIATKGGALEYIISRLAPMLAIETPVKER